MKKIIVLVFIFNSAISSGGTVLGKNYLGGSFDFVRWGTEALRETFGGTLALSAFMNINAAPNLDFSFGVARAYDEGQLGNLVTDIEARTIGGSAVVYMAGPVKPFLRMGVNRTSDEINITDGIDSMINLIKGTPCC